MENHQYAFAPRVSLALSGGAARGAFHLGVLRSLLNHNIEVVAISGTSIGAVVGAAFSDGKSPEAILEIFKSKAFKKMIRFSWKNNGFISMDPNAYVIKELYNSQRIESLKIPLCVTVTDVKNTKIKRFESGDIFPIVSASSALVPLFSPITYQGVEYIDGGVFDNLPVAPLKKYKIPILGVNLHPNEAMPPKGKIDWLKRMISLGWHGNILENISDCDYYLAPQEINTLSLFTFKHLDKGFKMGKDYMDEMIANFGAVPERVHQYNTLENSPRQVV